MSVLVVNCGSSSVKYRVVDPDTGEAAASGVVERVRDHEAALLDVLERERAALDDVTAVAHRVVHGGDRFAAPALVDEATLEAIRALSALAPLHNPANVRGIEVARRALPDVPQVAVFDTAFHQTLPPHAYTYAVPREWERDHGVRRYGFHGTSHAYVSRRAAAMLGRAPEDVDVIVLHLGNGASACAVRRGRSVDTSMGLTPLEGLVMGTRSGDVDPAVPGHLRRVAGLDVAEVDAALNGRSGLLALAGDNDLREVHRRRAGGDASAALAFEVYVHRIRKYVGAYLAVLGGADAIAFTAGAGEHDADVRARVASGLERLGVRLDPARNAANAGGERVISAEGSPVALLVVPTDEEREMAAQATALLTARR